MGEQDPAGGAGCEADLGGYAGGDLGYRSEGDRGQVVPLAGQGEEPGLLARPGGTRRRRAGVAELGRGGVAGAWGVVRAGAEGHSPITRRRNPLIAGTGAIARRISRKIAAPVAAIGVGSSSARAWPVCRARAMTRARTPFGVPDARAQTAEGMIQMAGSRRPGAEARAFIARLIPAQAMFRVLARMARLRCGASAAPRAAKMTAPMSGDAGFEGGDGRVVLDRADEHVPGVPGYDRGGGGEDGQCQHRAAQPLATRLL